MFIFYTAPVIKSLEQIIDRYDRESTHTFRILETGWDMIPEGRWYVDFHVEGATPMAMEWLLLKLSLAQILDDVGAQTVQVMLLPASVNGFRIEGTEDSERVAKLMDEATQRYLEAFAWVSWDPGPPS
jgi:hypothetical protein